MAQISVNIRMDEELKKKIPFDVSADPLYPENDTSESMEGFRVLQSFAGTLPADFLKKYRF